MTQRKIVMISSPLMHGEYDRLVPDYSEYRTRPVDLGDTPVAGSKDPGPSRV